MQQVVPGGEGDQAPDHGCCQVPHEERHDIRGREGGGDPHLLSGLIGLHLKCH